MENWTKTRQDWKCPAEVLILSAHFWAHFQRNQGLKEVRGKKLEMNNNFLHCDLQHFIWSHCMCILLTCPFVGSANLRIRNLVTTTLVFSNHACILYHLYHLLIGCHNWVTDTYSIAHCCLLSMYEQGRWQELMDWYESQQHTLYCRLCVALGTAWYSSSLLSH